MKIKLMGIETVHAGKIFKGSEEDIQNLLAKHKYELVAQTRLDKFYLKQKTKSKDKRKGFIGVSPNFYKLHRQVHSQIA